MKSGLDPNLAVPVTGAAFFLPPLRFLEEPRSVSVRGLPLLCFDLDPTPARASGRRQSRWCGLSTAEGGAKRPAAANLYGVCARRHPGCRAGKEQQCVALLTNDAYFNTQEQISMRQRAFPSKLSLHSHSWNTRRPDATTIALRNIDPPHRRRKVTPRRQPVPGFVEVVLRSTSISAIDCPSIPAAPWLPRPRASRLLALGCVPQRCFLHFGNTM
jgi:hypothetical protein